MNIRSIAQELNSRAHRHAIGELQNIRARLRGSLRRSSSDIFSSTTIHDGWAFHHGGRKELQFNIGIEHFDGWDEFRWGVAFSFQRNQTLPSPDILIPKVRLFNDFLTQYPDRYVDMRMWHHRGNERSDESVPAPIPHELISDDLFVFLGRRAKRSSARIILADFDRLLPLYLFTEGGGRERGQVLGGPFVFRAGHSAKSRRTVASYAERQLDVRLRHNQMQDTLFRRLAAKYGAKNVRSEQPTGHGTIVDLVVRHGREKYSFYEIKTAATAGACIREALGQILEYSYWPGAQEPQRIVICGEAKQDPDAKLYLERLRTRFGLPISYERISRP